MEAVTRCPPAGFSIAIVGVTWILSVAKAAHVASDRGRLQASLTTDVDPRGHFVLDQRRIVRREGSKLLDKTLQLDASAGGIAIATQANPGDDDQLEKDATLAYQPEQPKTIKDIQPQLFQELSCPGEWRERKGFQKPFLCPSVKKKANCSWDAENEALALACNASCFCDPAGNRSDDEAFFYDDEDKIVVDIQQCKTMCKDTDPCYFTFITDEVGQNAKCRVYTECEDKEEAPPELGNASNGLVWRTCERFFGNYTHKTIALHNKWYNRFFLLDHKGKAVSSHNEIDVNMRSSITTAMRFVVTDTKNITKLNKEGEETMEDVASDEKTEKQKDGAEAIQETQKMGGPGIIALYNNNNGDGQHWMSIDEQGETLDNETLSRDPSKERKKFVGTQAISDASLFTVCYLGPGEIALHNAGTNRYVRMSEEGIEATGRSDCCKPPKALLDYVRFTVITLPPLQSTAGHITREDDDPAGPEDITRER